MFKQSLLLPVYIVNDGRYFTYSLVSNQMCKISNLGMTIPHSQITEVSNFFSWSSYFPSCPVDFFVVPAIYLASYFPSPMPLKAAYSDHHTNLSNNPFQGPCNLNVSH